MARARARPGMPAAAPVIATAEPRLQAMYVAVVTYIVFTFFRVHDFIPALKVVRPLQLLTVVILFLWLQLRTPGAKLDPLVRWQFAFIGAMLLGLPVVTNHFWWLNTIVDYTTFLVVFSLGMVTVAQSPVYRQKIIRLLLGAFMFLAIWGLLHNGVGPLNCWLEDENDLAGVLVVGMCLAYAMWAESPSGAWRWLAAAVGFACITGVVVSASRGGFLALVAAVGTIALLSGKTIKLALAALVLTVLALPFVPQSYINEISTIDDSANSYGKTGGQQMERIYTWRRSWEMFLAHPLVGVGAGNSSWVMSKYEDTYEARLERGRRRQVAGRAIHSVYFTLHPELGVVGVFVYFTIIVMTIRRVRHVLRQPAAPPGDASPRMLAMFVGPALVSYSVAGVFISVLWYPMLWLLVGLAIVMSAESARQQEVPGQ